MTEELLNQVKSIVTKASEFVLRKDFTVRSKGDVTNIVTSADIKVQEFLEKELTALLPGSFFFGEESDGSLRSEGYTWIVDPIDGTQNFARDLNESSICVGLCNGKEIELSVVFNPFKKEMYWAQKGKGAYLNGKKLEVSKKLFKEGLFCTAMSLYNKDYAKICNDIIMDAYYKCNDIRRFGSAALELCYLASGKIDLYYEYRLFPWDFAAASLIVIEAGGCICDPFEKEIGYSHPCPVIAANSKENLETLKGIVKKYMKDVPYLKKN